MKIPAFNELDQLRNRLSRAQHAVITLCTHRDHCPICRRLGEPCTAAETAQRRLEEALGRLQDLLQG